MRVGFKASVPLLYTVILVACGGGDKEQPQIGPISGHTGVVLNASFDPQIAVDGNGNAFAVWTKFDGVRKNAWANRYVAGSGWGSPQMIGNDIGGDADLPQIAFDGNGHAIAIWRHTDIVTAEVSNPSGNATKCKPSRVAIGSIWANRYDAVKQQWVGIQNVETDNSAVIEIISNPDGSELCIPLAHDAYNPHIIANGKGNFVAVWEQSDGVRKNIRANRYDAVAGKWGETPDTIEADTADANSPQIAVDGKGNFVAVWRQLAASRVIPNQYDSVQNKRYNLWANHFDAGNNPPSWGGATLISDNSVIPGDPSGNPNASGNADTPHVAMDANGNALAVWAQSNHIYASRYAVGLGWQLQPPIENDPNWAAAAPQIAMNAAGDATVVWEQYFDNDPHDNPPAWKNIWANRYVAGVWQAAQLIEYDDKGHALSPQIAFDGAGNALAVWRQWDGAHYSVFTNRFDAATGWGTVPLLIETDNAGDALSPQIAVDGAGNALAVWSQSNGVRTLIDANRYTVGVGWGSAALIEGQ